MKISGFTFLRNAGDLYYPVKESILSILDIVDEFIIALGKGNENDTTPALVASIQSPKIKIIHTYWDLQTFKNGTIYAQQTDIAKNACTGDWLFYLQGDEVIHEDSKEEIKQACLKYLHDKRVEGMVLPFLHFFGDYDHYYSNHCWYKKEIRIIRNLPDIHSWKDAQSFRVIPSFTNASYSRKENTRKLNCVEINARVFHYGWVRPPQVMQKKHIHNAINRSYSSWNADKDMFDYGRMDYCMVFRDTHPSVMSARIDALDWKFSLRFSGPVAINRRRLKHERTKYRILDIVEQKFLGGRVIGGFINYTLIKP